MGRPRRPRIYADFQKLDDYGRAILVCRGTFEDVAAAGIKLVEGLEVILFMDDLDENGCSDDLEVDAVIEFDKDQGHWVGRFDSRGFRHSSERE